MKYLRLTGRPPLEAVPPFFQVLADSEHAEEARLLGFTVADAVDGPAGASAGGGGDADRSEQAGGGEGATITLLFVVDGDREGMAAAMGDTAVAERIDTAALGADRFYLLADVRPAVAPLLRQVLVETMTRPGLVVVPPIVYRDGAVDARLVGHSEVVQAAVEGVPDVVDVTVDEVGEAAPVPGSVADVLSVRQREAVQAALELGYYDQPRGATHEDVAAALDCAPSTASEHLRKAETKLVRAAMR